MIRCDSHISITDIRYILNHTGNQRVMAAPRRKVRSDQALVAATLPNRLRSRIKAGLAITQLNECIAGNIELTNQQVTCIRIALGKCLPDAQPPKDADPNAIKDVKSIPTWKLLEAIDAEVIE
jgi:hypothetical protein